MLSSRGPLSSTSSGSRRPTEPAPTAGAPRSAGTAAVLDLAARRARRRGPHRSPSVVVRVLAKLEPGGAQLSALRVVRGLEASGMRSRVLVGWASPEGLALAERMGVEVEVYGDSGDLQWRADPGFRRWLVPRLVDAPIVHAHMFGAWWAAAGALPDGVPLVASEHNALTWPTGEPGPLLADGLRRVSRFYAHGPSAREAILRAGLDPELIRDGVSPIVELDGGADPSLPTPRIVYSGRLHREKGPDVLLEALALLPDAPPLHILGEGPLRPELEARVAELDLAGRVTFRGWQARPGATITGASVLVVPSRDESWSQTAVLGMARGVPVIGTDVDGLPATLADGRGIVVAPEDPRALADAIDDVVNGRRITDLVGARRYARCFSVERVAAGYAASYGQLLGAAPEDDDDLVAAPAVPA